MKLVVSLLISVFILLASPSRAEPPIDFFNSQVGPKTSLKHLQVDFSLTPSGAEPIAGETWSMLGEITNRSTETIWIINNQCQLFVPPEVWGASSDRGSFNAFFPTPFLPNAKFNTRVARVEPGEKYTMVWKIDSYDYIQPNQGLGQVFYRIYHIVMDFLFYRPENFLFNGTVKIWSENPPTVHFDESASDYSIDNLGSSFLVSATRPVFVGASPWVLMIGAVSGGIISFALQLFYTMNNSTLKSLGGLRYISVGFATAVLFTSIATILISRIGSSDFLINIKIHDVWGSAASGFILQWLGLKYFARQIDRFASQDERPLDSRPASNLQNPAFNPEPDTVAAPLMIPLTLKNDET